MRHCPEGRKEDEREGGREGGRKSEGKEGGREQCVDMSRVEGCLQRGKDRLQFTALHRSDTDVPISHFKAMQWTAMCTVPEGR